MIPNYRLIVVRNDGLSYTSDFAGWHAETSVNLYFKEESEDKRVLYIGLFEASSSIGGEFFVQREYFQEKKKPTEGKLTEWRIG